MLLLFFFLLLISTLICSEEMVSDRILEDSDYYSSVDQVVEYLLLIKFYGFPTFLFTFVFFTEG